jgi:hypothetical protein
VKIWLKRDSSLTLENEDQIVQVVASEQLILIPVSLTSMSGCVSLHISHAHMGAFQGVSLEEEGMFNGSA